MDRYPDQMLARQAKFMGALRTAGMPDHFYQQTIDDVEFREWLVEQVKEKLGNYEETETQKEAREIMGKNFLGIPEVVEHFGAISSADLFALQCIPFSGETLKACAETHVLVADTGMSLLDMRKKARKSLFYKGMFPNPIFN